MLELTTRILAASLVVLAVGCGGSMPDPARAEPPRPSGFPQPQHLVPLLRLDNPYLVQTAALIDRAGNDAEKRVAARQLIGIAKQIGSDQWRAAQRPWLNREHRPERLTPNEKRRWLLDWQKRHLVRIYDALAALETEPVLVHCRAVWRDETLRPIERKLALGILVEHGDADRGGSEPWSMPGSAPTPPGRPGTPGTTSWPTGPGGGPAAPEPPAPRSDAPRVKGGQIINVNEVVDALRPYFKQCYERALQHYGRFGSWIILNAQVSGDGRVAAVSGSGDDSTPLSMMTCLKNVVAHARFAPPVGGSAQVEIPLAFTVR